MTSTQKKGQKKQFECSCKCKDHEIIPEKHNECLLLVAKIILEWLIII